MEHPLKIVPLGGLGEFGMNCLVVERGSDAVVIDCGVMFPEDHMLGIDRVIPDMQYLRRLKDRLKGFVLTHGHEDHIGALPYIFSALESKGRPLPVFATRFTRRLLESKFDDHPHLEESLRIEEFKPGENFRVGRVDVEGLRVTHSIVDAVGLALRAGNDLVVHTGDFKLDPSPVDGRLSDIERFKQLGDEGVRLLLSDSTNVGVSGESGSESSVPGFLEPIFERTRGRIFVTTFASHIHRIQNIVDLCRKHNRLIAFVGRSLERNASIATHTGDLVVPGNLLISAKEAERLPNGDVCIVATGSQAEPGSAVSRMSMNENHRLHPGPDDAVIFSSKAIPGNEKAIGAVIDEIYRSGAEVYDSRVQRVHVSGHACREELQSMLEMTRPECFVPLHGSYRNLVLHSRLAIETGVEPKKAFTLVDGDVLEIDEDGARRAGSVPVGRVLIDGSIVGDVDDAVLRDRRHISEDGVVMIIVRISHQTGDVLDEPEFIARGLIASNGDSNEFEGVTRAVKKALREMGAAARTDTPEVQEAVRSAARRYFRKTLGRRPVVVPYILEL